MITLDEAISVAVKVMRAGYEGFDVVVALGGDQDLYLEALYKLEERIGAVSGRGPTPEDWRNCPNEHR